MSYASPPPPEPTTTGGNGMKIFLTILGVFLVGCFLCCGGVIVGGWWLGSKGVEMAKEVAERTVQTSENPVEIDARTERIVKMDPPEGLRPRGYWEASNPFSGELFMSVSTYQDEANDTTLVIGEFGKLYEGSVDSEQLRRAVEESMQDQGADAPQEINPHAVDTLPATIHGEPVSFVVLRGATQQGAAQQGDNAADGQAAEQVMVQGTFKTERGTGFLLLQGPSDKLSDDEINRFVESLE
ncbi:MAG: hypothetical protein WD030_04435 [Pirellulales bacterium]